MSDNNNDDDQPFTKFDAEKPKLNLLPPKAVEEVGRVLTYGARKYPPDNWRKVDDTGRYIAAALRHVFAYMRDEVRDPETGLHHLGHAVCCLLFTLELDIEDCVEKDPVYLPETGKVQTLKSRKMLKDHLQERIDGLEKTLEERDAEIDGLQTLNDRFLEDVHQLTDQIDELKDQSLRNYQELAGRYIQDSQTNEETLLQGVLGMTGELGEIANQVEKVVFQHHDMPHDELREYLRKELGDVFWYFAATATSFNISLQDVADKNLEKLGARYNKGKFTKEDSQQRKDQA